MITNLIDKLQEILNKHKRMVESGTEIKIGDNIKQKLIKSIDDFLYPNSSKRLDKAFEAASVRQQVGIDFEMNMNSLKQELEEIRNPIKSEGRKDD